MKLEKELSHFEGSIKRLKVDFDRFLAGAVAVPPEDLRREVFDELRWLRSRLLTTYADRFRLNNLEARLNTLNELYSRRLRDHELGADGGSSGSKPRGPDPYRGVVFDGTTSEDGAMALYEELYGASGRDKKTDFASFHGFLEKKARRIRDLTGCGQVRFRVISKAGRLTLKAKPVQLPATTGKESPGA